MIFSELEYQLRDLINDSDPSGYRFPRKMLQEYVIGGVREIRRLRPDARFNSDGGVREFSGLWAYIELSDKDEYLSGYQGIRGWDREEFPILYFTAATVEKIEIYSDSGRTALVAEVIFSEPEEEYGIPKRVIEKNSSLFSGSVNVDSPLNIADTWEVKAVEADILDDVFRYAVVVYAAHRAYARDSEDTFNSRRAGEFYNQFLFELGVGK